FDNCFEFLERSEWNIFDPAFYLSVHVQFHVLTEMCRRQPELPEFSDLRIIECRRNEEQFLHVLLLCNMRTKYTAHGKSDDIDPVHTFAELSICIPCFLVPLITGHFPQVQNCAVSRVDREFIFEFITGFKVDEQRLELMSATRISMQE